MLKESSGVEVYRLPSGRMWAWTPLAAYTPAAYSQKLRLVRFSTGFGLAASYTPRLSLNTRTS